MPEYHFGKPCGINKAQPDFFNFKRSIYIMTSNFKPTMMIVYEKN